MTDRIKQSIFDQIFRRSFMAYELEEMENDVFGFTVLEGNQVACFDSGGEKLICLPQVLEIIKNVSISAIESAISKLSLVLLECNPLQIEILHRYNILPHGTTYCGLMSQSNAERLCKILHTTTESQIHLSQSRRKSAIPAKYQHRIRVMHDCFGLQKGILFPQLYVSLESKCIECFDCGRVFSPPDFVGHTHSNSVTDQEVSLCHWGFKSSNWRWYLRLADDPSRLDEEESSLRLYLDEIKNRYTGSSDDPLVISCEQERQTPIDSESLDTSPSLPTPPSLSPPSGINKNIQNSGSIFQQCILKIYNTPLANNEDRHQILNFLVMLRQEHLKQISSLVSERQDMMKMIMKNMLPQPDGATNETPKRNTGEDENHLQLLDSVKRKISILKGSQRVKRHCQSHSSDVYNPKQSSSTGCTEPIPLIVPGHCPIMENNPSIIKSDVSDCESTTSEPKMAISSHDPC